MKLLLASAVATALVSLTQAAPTDDLRAAAEKLAAAPNFAYTATTEIANAQFPAMPAETVTEKGGFTVTTLTFNGNTRQTVRKGATVAMQNRDGEWMTLEELRQAGGGGRGGLGFFGAGNRIDAPAELTRLVGKLQDVRATDDKIVATLKPEDAAELLTFGRGGASGGNAAPAPKNASAELTFWLKDGALAKYVVHTRGTVTTPNGDEREVDLTTTTEIKDVGHTKVVVPEGAKKKFGG